MPSASSSSQIYYDSSSDYSTDVDAEGMETLPDHGTDLRMVGIKRFLDKSIISRYEEAAEKCARKSGSFYMNTMAFVEATCSISKKFDDNFFFMGNSSIKIVWMSIFEKTIPPDDWVIHVNKKSVPVASCKNVFTGVLSDVGTNKKQKHVFTAKNCNFSIGEDLFFCPILQFTIHCENKVYDPNDFEDISSEYIKDNEFTLESVIPETKLAEETVQEVVFDKISQPSISGFTWKTDAKIENNFDDGVNLFEDDEIEWDT